MKKRIFIGGAWPYANSSLHIGHIAALLPGDVIARYYRKTGNSVLYVSGSDCHGTPITLRAREEHCNPADIVNRYHEEFCDCFEKLQFTYDNYTSTCEQYHVEFVKKCIQEIYNNGYIYAKEEEQEYCENCHQYLSDREIEGICPVCGGLAKGDQCDFCMTTFDSDELKDKHCKYCGQPVSLHKNQHLYWALSKFQKNIEDYVIAHKDIWRFNAINESLKYLTQGLCDRAVTRQLDWGIDIPISGFEDKKVYVWIEAVLGYLSAGKYFCEQHGITDWEKFYQEPSISYYVHGKDNIPFHSLIYPALLLSLKEKYKLPDYIVSSEYLNVNDEKISKSKGNGITVKELISKYPTDTIRFYMISQSPERRDSNFSYTLLEQLHNKKLVDEYGNFVNRNLAFLVKKFGGITPSFGIIDSTVKTKILETYSTVGTFIANAKLKAAINEIQNLVQFANKYYDEQRPWITVKNDIESFYNTTVTCLELIVNIANLYEPFIPNSSKKVFDFFGITSPAWEYLSVNPCTKLSNVSILFNRI